MKIRHFVIFSIVACLVYALAEFITGCWGVTHDTLTTCFFACFGGELLCTCALKIFEKQEKEEEEKNEDE